MQLLVVLVQMAPHINLPSQDSCEWFCTCICDMMIHWPHMYKWLHTTVNILNQRVPTQLHWLFLRGVLKEAWIGTHSVVTILYCYILWYDTISNHILCTYTPTVYRVYTMHSLTSAVFLFVACVFVLPGPLFLASAEVQLIPAPWHSLHL